MTFENLKNQLILNRDKLNNDIEVITQALEIYEKYNNKAEIIEVKKKKATIEQVILAYLSKNPDASTQLIKTYVVGKGYKESSVSTALSGLVNRNEIVNYGKKYRIFNHSTNIKITV